MTNVPDGYAFVAGRGREKAIALLAAADAAGIDQTLVRTANDGFIVPTGVAEEYQKGQAVEESSATEAPAKAAPKATRTRKKSTSD